MKKKLRILQLIDSLNAGGAERMAVNYANALLNKSEFSSLCCTRKEGILKEKISPGIKYLFLNKKSSLDFFAFIRLRNFILNNKVNLVQAHSTSFFFALLIKISVPNVKIIWHDHYGKEIDSRNDFLLKKCSYFFDAVITVNKDLLIWGKNNLKVSKIQYFQNFVPKLNENNNNNDLKKGKGTFRIVCLANLRPQKDHATLLHAFDIVLKEEPNVSLHLVGKDIQDNYSGKISTIVRDLKLTEKVFFYGEQLEIQQILINCDMGVLSSRSEGLPVALLEYGLAGLPVISTKVGECKEVIGGYGRIVLPGEPYLLAKEMLFYLENEEKRKWDAEMFKLRVQNNFSEEAIIPDVVKFFYSVL